MIFAFNGSELKRIGFTRTNTDPIAMRFSNAVDNAKWLSFQKSGGRKT
jgi:hypothetical protein